MIPNSYVESKRGGGYLHLQLDPATAKAFDSFTVLAPKALEQASRRAINKTLTWLRTHIARAVGREERIAISAIRERLKVYPVSGKNGRKGKVWFGINPLAASRIGRPRQGAAGVSVAGRRFQGAFYQTVYGGSPDIWIRKRSRHYDADRYFVTRQDDRQIDDPLRHRFPLAKAKVDLQSVRQHFEHWAKEAEHRLKQLLQQEVNYELHKLAGRARGGRYR
ncbi:phage tail protein [Chitiniphilus eburneus]|uniref:phage tail protein n=1 Tax=Chitiniphilus eburneus TaxID=2571148 RepID=UPI0035CF4A43